MDENGSLLGATYWGRTVSASFDSWGIEPDEQPGIVCGSSRRVGRRLHRGPGRRHPGEPVAANANASMTVTVV